MLFRVILLLKGGERRENKQAESGEKTRRSSGIRLIRLMQRSPLIRLPACLSPTVSCPEYCLSAGGVLGLRPPHVRHPRKVGAVIMTPR